MYNERCLIEESCLDNILFLDLCAESFQNIVYEDYEWIDTIMEEDVDKYNNYNFNEEEEY